MQNFRNLSLGRQPGNPQQKVRDNDDEGVGALS